MFPVNVPIFHKFKGTFEVEFSNREENKLAPGTFLVF